MKELIPTTRQIQEALRILAQRKGRPAYELYTAKQVKHATLVEQELNVTTRDCDTSPNCKKYDLGVDNNETN